MSTYVTLLVPYRPGYLFERTAALPRVPVAGDLIDAGVSWSGSVHLRVISVLLRIGDVPVVTLAAVDSGLISLHKAFIDAGWEVPVTDRTLCLYRDSS